MISTTPAIAQVRGKRPDRGTYQPPQLESVQLETLDPIQSRIEPREEESGTLRKVTYQDVDLVAPITQQEYEAVQYEEYGHEVYDQGEFIVDGNSCDSYGCDAMGCDGNGCGSIFNSSISRCRDQWFGSLELLMMHRSGDRLPRLVTTGPNEAGADSQTLFGGDTLLKDVTAGGRVTIGTWIDPQHCRSLVLRGWTATEESYDFSSDQDSNAILGLPFRNVSDDVTPFNDVRIISSPGRATGNVQVNGTSNVFGGDLSVRQHVFGKLGGNVDVLYGYQYMRLNEDMTIASSSVSLDDDFAPEGTILSTTDAFDIDNEFHGGQFGIAGSYRESCWSFSGLAKVGFGSLRRRAELSGQTFTSIDGNNAIDPQGLLVRDTNSGTSNDSTFGWIPELDFSLGYHKFPNYELTIGYHIIAMTDALQVSGALDPNLASNLSDPALGIQSPAADFRYNTFYVQGIHFGIQYVH
ncbi:BBP7 family outer membrane beta-barrel protein [Rubripirellula obstinata]|uniref:BBP7 family outer membrane beta-barrel protein n=1 Tax=Rubripirellula obstinata TaxID=406547 RepID=UPI00135B1D3E|nr:BBP7 family outer membrane beta-barrel protein [Rubripirellula obstinata]